MTKTVKSLQKDVDTWIRTYGKRYFDVKTNTLILMEEVGEFARLISRRYGEQSFKKVIPESEVKTRIEEELADIFFVSVCLANQLKIDIEGIMEENIKKKTKRDRYRHQKNEKLD